MHPSREMAIILRDALRRVELSMEINPEDPILEELRRLLLLKIASLEGRTARKEYTGRNSQLPST
jgi:hypothetical protein